MDYLVVVAVDILQGREGTLQGRYRVALAVGSKAVDEPIGLVLVVVGSAHDLVERILGDPAVVEDDEKITIPENALFLSRNRLENRLFFTEPSPY